MQHVNIEILKENQNLRLELKELTSITETWLNSSNKVNLCINEQIPTQKKKILGIGQLTEDTSSCGLKDLVFVKSSADNSDMSIISSNLHKSSEPEGFTLPNHDIDEVPSNKSQRNTTDPSAVVSDSPTSDYDSADESSVCSTPLLPLKKLDSAELSSGPKTVKLILKSKSTFKAETLKGITLNEPSSAPARGNKSPSASKTNSAPAGKLKNVKVEDNPPLAMVMKELNELKLQISKKKSSYSRNKNTQQVPLNALQNKYKTQFKMNCKLCGQNNHLSENCYEVLFCKRRGINPRNPQHVTKNCETCGSNVHTTSDHNDIEWFRKRENPHAKKAESSNALRSKTPTKRSDTQVSLISVNEIKQILRNPTLLLLRELFELSTNMDIKSTSGGIYGEVGLNTFRNTIGTHYLPHSSEYVAPPSIDVVRKWFPTIGYGEEVSTKGTLRKSLLPPRNDVSADFITEADPGLSAPNDSIPLQQGMDERTKNTSYDHIFAGTDPHVLADQTKSVSEGLETFLTQPTTKKGASSTTIHGDKEETSTAIHGDKEEDSSTIKLWDLAKLVSQIQPSFRDLDSPEDYHVIIVDESDEDEPNAKTEDTSVPRSSSHISLPTELKGLPSKINELTEEIKGLKTQTLQWKLPEEFISLPLKVESAQAKLKTLDALPSLLLNVTKALNKFEEKDTNQATISQLFQRKAKKIAEAEKENLNQQPKTTTTPTTTPINPPIITTTTQMQTPLQSPPKSSFQPEGEHIKKDKGKKTKEFDDDYVTFAMVATENGIDGRDWSKKIDADHIDELAIRNKVINKQNSESSGTDHESCESKNNWVDSDDEEVPLRVSEIKKQTVLNSETSSENKSPRSKDSFGQRSRRRGLGCRDGKLCFVCYSPDHFIKDCDLHERNLKKTQKPKPLETKRSKDSRSVWNNTSRVNHRNFSSDYRHPHQRRSFIPLAVLTREGLKSTVRSKMSQAVLSQSTASAFYQNTARPKVSKAVLSQSTARPYFPRPVFHTSTGRPYYPRMDNVRPRASSSSPPKRFFNTRTVDRPKSPKPIMKSKWVKKESTAGTQAVLPQTKGEKGSVVTSPTQTWRPKGAYLDHRHKNNSSYKLKKFEYVTPLGEFKRQGQTLKFQGLRRRLVSWQCKKQTIMAISSTEAEYVAAASCCGQSTAKVRMLNEVAYIEAKIAGKKILVSKATVRTDLMFNDEDGTNCFDNQVIWDTLRDIGYEGSLTLLSFSKPLFSPQWKYLVHTLLHCLSSKSSSWDQFGTNIASALVGLATNQKFNFSKLIFDGMLRNLKDSKPFLMYPRFIQLFLNKQLEGITKPQNFLPTVVLPSKVFTFMSKCSPKFSGKLTPLTPHMLEVATAVRDEHSLHTEELDINTSSQLDINTSSQHSDDSSAGEKAKSPSPVASERTDSPNDYTPTDEVQTSGGDEGNLDLYGLTREVLRLKKLTTKQAAQILRLKTKLKILWKKVKPVIAEYRSFVKLNANLSKKKKLKKTHQKKSSSFKQGRKKVSDKSIGLNEVDADSGDAQVFEGTFEDFEGTDEVHGGTDKVHESTAKVNEGTAKVNEGTAEVIEGTAKVNEGTDEGNESTAGANLSTEPSMKEVEDEAGPSTFQDESDEFIQDDTLIADLLVNISKNRRGAGITIPGNIPEQERPKSPTLTLDPKDKGKGIMKEEPKKKKLTLQQLRAAETANDEEFARRVAAEWEEEEERKRLAGLERLQAELEDNEMIAAEVQRTERENFTEEQKAKFLVETIAAQRRFRVEQQAALRRSKPPTIPQLRNQMMKYIRNVSGKAYRNLKNKSYEEIRDIYEKVKRFNDEFVAIGSTEDEQAIKEMNVKAEEPSKKRKGDSAQDVEVMEQRSLISRFSIVQSPEGEYIVF
ncbi:hypothetical protein Tco_1029630 [Tanacetum coccineum]|uniref:CCHC-type domain-containing protein n=1 Tax=Tanacetum coccineum TaxID=301880 RepID=A0ABQ5G3Z0_9ASTR